MLQEWKLLGKIIALEQGVGLKILRTDKSDFLKNRGIVGGRAGNVAGTKKGKASWPSC